MSIQSFIPRRVVAVFKQQMMCYYATATAQPSGCFNVQASSFFQPFSNVPNTITSAGAGKGNLTTAANFAINQSPIGYSEMDALYQYYKVRRAKLRVKVMPNSDVMYICGAPTTIPESSSTPSPGLSAMPYSKNAILAPGMRPVTLSWNNASPTILGYSPTQYEGLTPTIMGAAPGASGQWYFNIIWSTGAGTSNPTANVYFEIELWQEVELSGLEIFST